MLRIVDEALWGRGGTASPWTRREGVYLAATGGAGVRADRRPSGVDPSKYPADH